MLYSSLSLCSSLQPVKLPLGTSLGTFSPLLEPLNVIHATERKRAKWWLVRSPDNVENMQYFLRMGCPVFDRGLRAVSIGTNVYMRRQYNGGYWGRWEPRVPEGKVVVLSFRFIDLESDNLCRYDYVDVYSGHVRGQRLGRFCGTFRPGALVSTGNKMLIQMVSDANTAGSGFLAVYSAAEPHERGDQYCGGRLDKPFGSIKTPNWPEKDYPAGVTCSWHIVAPKNQIIEVKFEKFDVERDNYCRYDYVAFFNGAEINDAKRIGKYSLKYSVGLCQQKCKRSGTIESNYCTSDFGSFRVISLGLHYIFMGSVDDDGKGKIAPHHFVMAFKAKNQRGLNVLKTKRC
ncbi:unnamed protein product, partial [Coregonus sp. 'balchen']